MATKTFYFFNDNSLPIDVSEDTVLYTGNTFYPDGKMWEGESEKEFFRHVPMEKQCNIVDIGAQSGLYSLYAKYLPNATFYSFEPFPLTYKLLNENLKINNITNVKTYDIAISDKTGTATLNTCISHNGLHTLGKNPLRFNDIKAIEVKTDTLDNLFYENNIPINYLKIDTEGYEYYILKGGIKTLKKYKPLLQIEYHTSNMMQCSVKEEDLNNLLNELNYKNYLTNYEEKFYI